MQHFRPMSHEEAHEGVKSSLVVNASQISLAVNATGYCSVQPGAEASSRLQPDITSSSDASEVRSCEQLSNNQSKDSIRDGGSCEAQQHQSNGVSGFSSCLFLLDDSSVTLSQCDGFNGAISAFVFLFVAQH